MSYTGMRDADEMPSPTRDFDSPIDYNKLASVLSFLVDGEEQSDVSSKHSSGIPLSTSDSNTDHEMAGDSVPSFGDRSCSLLPPIGQDIPTSNPEAPDTLRLGSIRFKQTGASPTEEERAALAAAPSVTEERPTPMNPDLVGQDSLMADSSRFEQKYISPVTGRQEQHATSSDNPIQEQQAAPPVKQLLHTGMPMHNDQVGRGALCLPDQKGPSPFTPIKEKQAARPPSVEQMYTNQVGGDAHMAARLSDQTGTSPVARIQEQQAAVLPPVKQMFNTPMDTGKAPSLEQNRTPDLTPLNSQQVGRGALMFAPCFQQNRTSLVTPVQGSKAAIAPVEQKLLSTAAFSRNNVQGARMAPPSPAQRKPAFSNTPTQEGLFTGAQSFGKALPKTMPKIILAQGQATDMVGVAQVPSVRGPRVETPRQIDDICRRGPVRMVTRENQQPMKRPPGESDHQTSAKRRRYESQPPVSEARPVQIDDNRCRGAVPMVTGADRSPMKLPPRECDYISIKPCSVIVGHFANTSTRWLPLATKFFKEWTKDRAITSVQELNELKRRIHRALQKTPGAGKVPENWQDIPFLAPNTKWHDKKKKHFKETENPQEYMLPDKNRTVAKLITDEGVLDLERNRRIRPNNSPKFGGSAAKALTDALREVDAFRDPLEIEVAAPFKTHLNGFKKMRENELAQTKSSGWINKVVDRQVIAFVNIGWKAMMKEIEERRKRTSPSASPTSTTDSGSNDDPPFDENSDDQHQDKGGSDSRNDGGSDSGGSNDGTDSNGSDGSPQHGGGPKSTTSCRQQNGLPGTAKTDVSHIEKSSCLVHNECDRSDDDSEKQESRKEGERETNGHLDAVYNLGACYEIYDAAHLLEQAADQAGFTDDGSRDRGVPQGQARGHKSATLCGQRNAIEWRSNGSTNDKNTDEEENKREEFRFEGDEDNDDDDDDDDDDIGSDNDCGAGSALRGDIKSKSSSSLARTATSLSNVPHSGHSLKINDGTEAERRDLLTVLQAGLLAFRNSDSGDFVGLAYLDCSSERDILTETIKDAVGDRIDIHTSSSTVRPLVPNIRPGIRNSHVTVRHENGQESKEKVYLREASSNAKYVYEIWNQKDLPLGVRGDILFGRALLQENSGDGHTVFASPSAQSENVVIKRLRRAFIDSNLSSEGSENPYKEIAMMQTYGGNRHLMGCHEALYDDKYIFIVMPRLPGDLFSKINWGPGGGYEPKADVPMIARKLLENLRFLRDNGIVHRDIKPENVLIGASGPIFCDFGLAVQLPVVDGKPQLIHSAGSPAGSPSYISPEVYHSQPFGHKVDIWALASVIFNALTGLRLYMQPIDDDHCYCFFISRGGLKDEALCDSYLAHHDHHADPVRERIIALHSVRIVYPSVASLLQRILHPDPEQRPDVEEIMKDPFFVGYREVNE